MLKKNAPFLEKEAKELFVFGNDRPRGDGIGVGRSAGRSCDRLLSLRPRLHSRFFYGFLFGGLNGRTVDGGRNRGACVGRGLLLLGRLISRLLLFFLFLLLLESLDRLRRLALHDVDRVLLDRVFLHLNDGSLLLIVVGPLGDKPEDAGKRNDGGSRDGHDAGLT